MSWFGAAPAKVLADKVQQATSELIPNGDIDLGLALEISDLIRSKQVPPKEAMRVLKKRFLEGANANQQKAALRLVDFCIKNGGAHYIQETASKEFMDPLVVFLKGKSNNEGVKEALLGMIQTWSILVSKDSRYDYINTIYRKLQHDGFSFPPLTEVVDSTMIESKVAPEWEDSDACMLCSEMFTLLNRKHHCRSCGGVFCQTHSSQTSTIPELGINIPVRVCDNCYADQKQTRKRHRRKSKKAADTDDDLRRAIELSLQDAGMATSAPLETVTKVTDDEDEAMRAAIEASLRDLKEPEPAPSQQPKEESTGLYANFLNDVDVSPENKEYQPPLQQFQPDPQYQPIQQQQYHQLQSQPQPVQFQSPPQYQQPPHQSVQQNIEQALQPVQQAPEKAAAEAAAQGEHKVVEFVDILSKLKTIPESQRVVDPSLVQLHTDVALMSSKVNEQIARQKEEIEHCQAMYAKSFAVSRLYDDILAYRLKQENQMMKTKKSYAAKVLQPAPPIPTASHGAPIGAPARNRVSPSKIQGTEPAAVAERKVAQQPSMPPPVSADAALTKPVVTASESTLEPSAPPNVPTTLTPSAPPSEQPTQEDRLEQLKGTVVPTRYALPPTLAFPAVPSEPLPSAPAEEPVANLIDI